MKRLSFESPSELLVLCGFLSLLLGAADSSTVSPETRETGPTPVPTPGPTPSSIPTTTRKPPADVANVRVENQTETSISLGWDKVEDISTYQLYNNNTEKLEDVNVTNAGPVKYLVSNLTATTLYSFTVFTLDGGLISNGKAFTAPTAPENVLHVTVVNRTEDSITLEWRRVDSVSTYTLEYDGKEININESTDTIRTEVTDLTAGTEYSFTLFTVFENVKSSGHSFPAVTAPKNVLHVTVVNRTEDSITLEWQKVDSVSTYTLEYDGKEINISESTDTIRTVVPDLTDGTEYSFTLFTVFKNVKSSGHSFLEVTAPRNTKTLKSAGQDETSITLEWEKVDGIDSYILVFAEQETTINASEVSYTISNLTSGEKYNFIFFTEFENVTSSGLHLDAVTAPRNVENVTVVDQTETNITMEWAKVGDSFTYTIEYDGMQSNDTVNDDRQSGEVTHTVSLPDPGRKYNFTLYTTFDYAKSKGHTFTASTVPRAVGGLNVMDRSLTSITLQWKNENNDWKYQIIINDNHDAPIDVPFSTSDVVSHEVELLNSGTKYTFSVLTLFDHLLSKLAVIGAPTTIDCNTGDWQVTSTSVQATIDGVFTKATLKNKTGSPINTSKTITFTGLYPGETYKILLEYELTPDPKQCERQLTLYPSDPEGHCEYEGSGYSIRVIWNEPLGVCTNAEVNVSGKRTDPKCEARSAVIHGFEPARTYQVSLGFLSGEARSQKPLVFDCNTDPRGVIAGSVMAVLIFIILVCVALFIILKRPDIIRRKKSFIGGSKLSIAKAKAIPISRFHSHFSELSLDENRGFRLEYDSLSPVGREQTQKAAELQVNAARNRFTNVLPYDWNRVKLNTSDFHESSDYINASYMPGYKNNREYIATQGPLPSTLDDFWRMIWQQQVKQIVMVTNCTELGRTKCEQYWPPDGQSRVFKELSVITTSEQQESNWTLRNFSVKHRSTSEERTVRHFHFTAWPDHGVPQGTDVLIQFRGLMRQHIDSERGKAPTVVHCSAGVGRTGTIIALDVLLQQLEKEQTVGINAFVHRMRLNRPYMVQTESQYVFLHQCIMDSLQTKRNSDDHIYENTADVIYVNATALQDLQKSRDT